MSYAYATVPSILVSLPTEGVGTSQLSPIHPSAHSHTPSTPHAPRPTSAEHPATQRLNVTLSHKCADTSAIRTPNAIAPVRRPPRARFGPFPPRRVLVSAFTASRRRRTPPRRDVSSSSDRDETDAIATASAFPRTRTHVVRARCMPAFELNVTHRSPSRSRVTARVDDVSRRRAARAPTDALGTLGTVRRVVTRVFLDPRCPTPRPRAPFHFLFAWFIECLLRREGRYEDIRRRTRVRR